MDFTLQQVASKFINNTNRPVFLTGKAGTGKTTFLKQITQSTHKNTVVAAPTGIAAINAGGVTLHSLFQLPFGTFVPDNYFQAQTDINFQLHTPKTLIANVQMNKYKRKLLQEMELLIIDEVSMLRADLLDAIDSILKYVRRNKNTFGGVQILFIGDMLQLPPIVQDNEWSVLTRYYSGMYFFNALALQDNQLVYIELDKIYRQSNQEFISLLNNLRNNTISSSDIDVLNTCYKPDFEPKKNDGYIYLTTHNYKADSINAEELKKIDEKLFSFNALIDGDFSEYNYPLEYTLELKKGAQVMFIKNDYSGYQRFFNGKIGYVSEIDNENIEVSFTDGSEPTVVEHYTWENKRFSLNRETNEIEEKIIGTFIHYPIKPAWAITIHKSQGLTFEKAIIDVSKAFAPGQAYVALSRLTSLNGLVLTSKVPLRGLEQNDIILDFVKQPTDKNSLLKKADEYSADYIKQYALHAFDFSSIENQLNYHISTYNKAENRSEKQKHKAWAVALTELVKKEKCHADNFLNEINQILAVKNTDNLLKLKDRIAAAKKYFEPKLKDFQEMPKKLIAELKSVKGTQKYKTELKDISQLFFSQLSYIYKVEALITSITDNRELSKTELKSSDLYKISSQKKQDEKKPKPEKEKKQKVDTKKESLRMFLDGLKPDEIAKERGLKTQTIENHLAYFVEEGVLEISDFLEQSKVEMVCEIAKELDTTQLGPIKEIVLDDMTWSEIRLAVAHYKHINNISSTENN